jgi:hypothetical protein
MHFGSLGLAIVLTFHPSARADPITYTASQFVDLGGLGYESDPVTLAPWGNWPTTLETIDNLFSFQLRYHPTGSPQDWNLPRLDVVGHVTGNYVYTKYNEREGGSFTGSITSINLLNSSGTTDIPQPLLDLIHHPERIHVSGSAPGTILSQFSTYLTIDPPAPAPVPEPPAMTTFLALIGAWAGRRRLRSAVGLLR